MSTISNFVNTQLLQSSKEMMLKFIGLKKKRAVAVPAQIAVKYAELFL
jgi:hypothetical protein